MRQREKVGRCFNDEGEEYCVHSIWRAKYTLDGVEKEDNFIY